MERQDVLNAIKEVRSKSLKRNFTQGFDLVVNLKDLDLKKPEHQVDLFVMITHTPKKKKIAALVGPEMAVDAKAVMDSVITSDEFPKYAKDKKITKKLAGEFDFFIAQANLMAQVAGAFGRVLGIRGKMPNPKAGCVVPPKTPLKPLYDKLQNTVRVSAKKDLMIQCLVGNEKMEDEDIAENIMTIYNALIHHLPNEENNVRKTTLKFTMGAPVKVGAKKEEKAEKKVKRFAKKEEVKETE